MHIFNPCLLRWAPSLHSHPQCGLRRSKMSEYYKDKPLAPARRDRFTLSSFFQLPDAPHQRKARQSRVRTLITLSLVALLLFTPLYLIYRPPGFLINFFQNRWPDVLFEVNTKEKLIALTIDDAPSQYTAEIRQVLKDNEAKATFFVIGSQVSDYKKELQDLVLDGHELGNHAMFDERSKDLPIPKLVEQINGVDELISAAYEAENLQRPNQKFFRPGAGFFSDEMRKTVTNLGYKMVLGTAYPHDAQIDLPSLNAWHIMSMIKPGRIIICHDRRSWLLPMLRSILPDMKRKGYQVVTVGELLRRTGQLSSEAEGVSQAASEALQKVQTDPDSSSKENVGKDGRGQDLVEGALREGEEGGAALEEEREG